MSDTTDDEELTFAEMMEFASGRVETESEQFPGEVPDHAPSLLVSDIGALHGTLMNIQMAQSNDELEDPSEEQITAAIEEDVVDILFSLGALSREYDLDIASAFEDRIEQVRNYEALEEAMQNAEGQEEQMEALEEHMDEEALGEMMGMMGGGDVTADGMAPPPEPGDDVADDEYDPEDPTRHIE